MKHLGRLTVVGSAPAVVCLQCARAGPSAADLGGTSWQLVKFQSSDEKTLTPDDRAKYTIAFGQMVV